MSILYLIIEIPDPAPSSAERVKSVVGLTISESRYGVNEISDDGSYVSLKIRIEENTSFPAVSDM